MGQRCIRVASVRIVGKLETEPKIPFSTNHQRVRARGDVAIQAPCGHDAMRVDATFLSADSPLHLKAMTMGNLRLAPFRMWDIIGTPEEWNRGVSAPTVPSKTQIA